MKNVSFLQLVLGVSGAILIYSGVKDIDLIAFMGDLVRDPKKAFTNNYSNSDKLLQPGETGEGQKGEKPRVNKPNFNDPLGDTKPSGTWNI